MRRRILPVLVIVSVIALLFVSGAAVSGDSSAPPQESELDGVVIPIPENERESYLSSGQEVLQNAGLGVPSEMRMVATPQGTFLLFSDSEISKGEITASGTLIRAPLPDVGADGVMLANDVETSTEGPTLSIREYNRNRDEYAYEVVHIEGRYQQVSFLNDVAEYTSPSTVGVLTTGAFSAPPFLTKGGVGTAQWLTVNASSPELDGSVRRMQGNALRGSGQPVVVFSYDPAFVLRGPSTVSVSVVPPDQSGLPFEANRHVTFAIGTDVDAKNIGRLPENGDLSSHNDQIIRFRAQLVGARVSTKRTLERVASCGPDTVMTGATPPGCIPLTYDSTIHTGVAFNSESGSDGMVPYLGVSSNPQDRLATQTVGEYEITARVVPSARLGDNIGGGWGLLVYDIERVGPAAAGGENGQDARNKRQGIRDAIRNQLGMGSQTETTSTPSPTSTTQAGTSSSATSTGTVVEYKSNSDQDDDRGLLEPPAAFQNQAVVKFLRVVWPIFVGLVALSPVILLAGIWHRYYRE